MTLPEFCESTPNSIRRGPFGSAIKKEFFVSTGYKVYEQQNAIYDDCERGNYFIDDQKFKELKSFEVGPGDIIISCSGTIGRIAILPAWAKKGVINQALLKLTLNHRVILPHYFLFLFHQKVDELIAGNVRGSAMVNITSVKDLKKILWPIPPLDAQREITAEIEKQLTRLEAGVSGLRRVQANLKRYRAAVLKAACEGKLVPTEAELAKQSHRTFESGAELLASISDVAPSEAKPRRAGRLWGAGHVPDLTHEERLTMPRGWVWTKVRDLGFDPESAVQVGPMSMKSEDFTDDGVPVLNVGCVQWDRFEESKLDHLPPIKASDFERYRIKPGDVLFTRSGTVGRCAVAQSHQDGWLMTFHLLRARPNPRKCLPAFLRAVFEGAPHIRRQSKAASVGSTRAGFNTNLLANLAVPLPPLAEQTRIVAEVERRLSVVEELGAVVKANLQRATRLRQSILQRAFVGNRFVKLLV